MNIDKIREEFPVPEYEVIDSLNLISVLASNAIYPIDMKINSNGFNSCIYRKDDVGFINIFNGWNNGEYDEMKLVFKSFARIKKAFVTGNILDMKMYK
ncbi:hypothetical protein [Clostridium tagluense]|uniref:Uncharacterized protein n=1 Tax=Clostridium tagluense TaxID=360422 RepID=A0A401UUC7_9CLOT|nr:hypothetical protein [Clostridium tagluense]GCD13155.1 hypothetical protein Ctaglu_47780 [Clostridium tagluense]